MTPQERQERQERQQHRQKRARQLGEETAQQSGFRRVPAKLAYWITTERGRMPVGPYLSPRAALANGYELNLACLWWVETDMIGGVD